MKKYISLLLLSFALLWVGCSDDNDDAATLSIVSSDVEFDAPGGTGTITYSAEASVSASVNQSWVTLSTPSNGSVTYTVARNGDSMSRTAVITILSGDVTQEVAITQMGATIVVDDSYVVEGVASTTEFELTTNYDDVTVTADVDWVTVSVVDGVLVVTPQLNTGDERTATLTFVCGWKTVTATLIQNRVEVADVTELEPSYLGETLTVTVDEIINEMSSSWTATTNDDWLTVTVSDMTISITATANETGKTRTGEVTITAGDYTSTITVKQASGINASLLGTWYMPYATTASGSVTSRRTITLEASDDNMSYIMTGLYSTFEATVDYDSDTQEMSLIVQYLGRYGSYYTYLCFQDSAAGYYTWGTDIGFIMTYDEDADEITFADNGVWGVYTANSIRINCFSSTSLSSSTNAGYLARYFNVSYMYR